MVHDQFVKSEAMRRRYWGRSMVGWRAFRSSDPNVSHLLSCPGDGGVVRYCRCAPEYIIYAAAVGDAPV